MEASTAPLYCILDAGAPQVDVQELHNNHDSSHCPSEKQAAEYTVHDRCFIPSVQHGAAVVLMLRCNLPPTGYCINLFFFLFFFIQMTNRCIKLYFFSLQVVFISLFFFFNNIDLKVSFHPLEIKLYLSTCYKRLKRRLQSEDIFLFFL